MMELTATIQVYSLAATIQAASMTASILPGGMTADVAPASFTANIQTYNITASVVAGIPGADGTPGAAAEDITMVAGENISALRVVRGSVGGAIYADSSDVLDADMAVGISVAAASSGANVTVRSFGVMTDSSWSWTMDKPIYFTPTGALTQTAPTAGFSQQVGTPASATSINIQIKNSIKLA